MAINKNHEFEELNGVKCGIVEKMVSPQRATFLKDLLEYNGYSVVMIPSPLPKAPAPPPPVPGDEAPVTPPPPAPETFTMGVTDYTFNPTNAIFGRMLKTRNGKIVTLAYWQQKDTESHDDVPYFE